MAPPPAAAAAPTPTPTPTPPPTPPNPSFLGRRNSSATLSGSASIIKSIISSNVNLDMVFSLMLSNSSPICNFPERAAAPVRGRSQIRTPRCWRVLWGSVIGSNTIPMGLRRVRRISPVAVGCWGSSLVVGGSDAPPPPPMPPPMPRAAAMAPSMPPSSSTSPGPPPSSSWSCDGEGGGGGMRSHSLCLVPAPGLLPASLPALLPVPPPMPLGLALVRLVRLVRLVGLYSYILFPLSHSLSHTLSLSLSPCPWVLLVN
mmetsp:Transcript_19079/g.41565  ORF Transcript_19079/g.41565 Transcript_19079/m.41565 type:complete len:258 (-) Transcript_19079:1095-1868(-)